MGLKIVLVNPPYPHECHQHPPYIPLGIAYLGAVLMKSGFEASVVDAQMAMLSTKQIGERIAEIDPHVVGVTSTTLTYKSALRVAKMAKEAVPKCTTVIGGCHVTFWDQNVFQDSPDIDIIVRREGELTFVELLKKSRIMSPSAMYWEFRTEMKTERSIEIPIDLI